MRIRQEIVLGIGGYRALQALGLEPTVYHMNEGHSAFLGLEHVRQPDGEACKLSFAEARELAAASLVFTTHTPVEAGHDYFPPELMNRYFGDTARRLGMSRAGFPGARADRQDIGEFCMTVLALRLASRSNGVSKLHGEVSRQMWQSLWPAFRWTKFLSAISPMVSTSAAGFRCEMNQLYDRYLGPNWREEPANGEVWSRRALDPGRRIVAHPRTPARATGRLGAESRARSAHRPRRAARAEIEAADEVLDPDALTIGFARRFATYKRATLIFRDMDRLRRILTDKARPVQLIFAGKAHPQDDAGKELIQQITESAAMPELGRRIVFLEDYDMAVARYLVQGVDVWLNTPLRPLRPAAPAA